MRWQTSCSQACVCFACGRNVAMSMKSGCGVTIQSSTPRRIWLGPTLKTRKIVREIVYIFAMREQGRRYRYDYTWHISHRLHNKHIHALIGNIGAANALSLIHISEPTRPY